jgi:hypothetical protein
MASSNTFCTFGGKPLTSAGRFSPSCGGDLDVPVAPIVAPTPAAAPARIRSRGRSLPVAIRVGLVGLLAAVAFAGCGGGSTSSRATSIANQQSTAPIATLRTNTQSAEPTTEPSHGPTGFSPTGSMTIARQNETATRLQDGRVLIAGGESADAMTLIASAELYDPATGKFSATGSMATSRDFTTATLLADGRVLIAGGFDGSKSLASAELYDPTTGKFSPTGSMAVARFAHTSTLLPDGRVLIAGGDDKSDLASAEIYDPKTGKFSPTGSMSQARYSHTATLLQNGVVLIAGGDDDSGASLVTLASAELYDPATGKFNPTGSMQTAREYHTATLLSDGRALITGGYVVHPGSDDATLASAELYDPATGKFSATASIKNERRQHTATLLSDGRVLIAGGEDESETALASTELYDPEAGKFSPAGSLAQARFYHTATRLSDGRVLIAGGDDESGLASAELYQP